MREIWIEFIVNHKRWRVVDSDHVNNMPPQEAGEVAYYEMDENKMHYFYFQLNGSHFVLYGEIRRKLLIPAFSLVMINRQDFTVHDIRKVGTYSVGMTVLPLLCQQARVTCNKMLGSETVCELIIRTREELPPNLIDIEGELHIVVDED